MKRVKKQFWLSSKEANELKRKAELCGISQTSVIRILINGFEPKEKPDDRFYDMMRELYAIGNNLNQISRKANSLGFIDAPMLKQTIDRLTKFQLEIENKYLRPEESSLIWERR